MYPEADVSVLQLSLKRVLDPEEHLAAGRSLASLRDEGVVIFASGLSWHNLRLIGPAARESSQVFDDWLTQTLAAEPQERTERLTQWEQAPAA